MENDENVAIKEEEVSVPQLNSMPDPITTAVGEAITEVKMENTENGAPQEFPKDAADGENGAESDLENEDGVYDYLKRPNFSSEPFKIEIMKLPKFFGAGQLKKLFKKEQLTVRKIKMMNNCVFATFGNEEERQRAMERLKQCKFKGTYLDVKLAKPMQDPLIKKRKAAEAAEAQGEDKKPRIEVPIADQIVLKAAPYANKSYEEQLEIKKNDMVKALTNLTREIKKLNYQIKPYIRAQEAVNSGLICPFLGVIPSPVHEKYRNKCDFTIGVNPETEQLTVGFRASTYKAGSCAVGPIFHLPFIPDAMKNAVQLFENHFRNSGRIPYEPEDHSGFWRQLLLRTNLDGQILAIVMVHPQDLTNDDMEQVKTDLRSLVEGTPISSLYFQSFGSKKSNEEPPIHHLAGSTHLLEKLCGLEFAISPLAFFQVNTLAAEILYNTIGELAQVDLETVVLDVCCGTGTIGLSLAKICQRVFGVEMIPSAVGDAKMNAERNGISNCVFVAGKAEDQLAGLIKQAMETMKDVDETKKKIVAVVDPPRAGLQRRSVQLLRSTKEIQRLVYVSCNAESAMKSFVDFCRPTSNTYGGEPFVPVRAVAVDLFPDTPHCELIILFERYVNVEKRQTGSSN